MRFSAEELFVRFFLPLYPPDARADLAGARATDANPARNPAVLAHLEDAALVFAKLAPRVFAGRDLALDFSDASVHRLGAALTRERRDALAAEGAEGTEASALFNVVVHGAAYVGACALRGRDASWGVRRPLWESVVTLRSRAGTADLAVLQWWLKSLADDALDGATGGLAERYRAHVEVPSMDLDALPRWLPSDRRAPRLAKVRYDAFYKHIKAHLPELRDLGVDFPSAERFAEMRFKWLDFQVLGEGRMLLVYGPGEGGLHLFWLTSSGFDKAAFVPADPFPDPRVLVDGERLRVLTQESGASAVREWLWWGP